ncbi:winged helix-turn-helix domain-containing protein, partial [Pantoea endophytica]
LKARATRCLDINIISDGKPVTRTEMIEKVWINQGALVTEASVRQTFHLLRKALSTFCLSEHLIRTTRRQGYSINKTLVRRKRILNIESLFGYINQFWFYMMIALIIPAIVTSIMMYMVNIGR